MGRGQIFKKKKVIVSKGRKVMWEAWKNKCRFRDSFSDTLKSKKDKESIVITTMVNKPNEHGNATILTTTIIMIL